ncbi:MAG: Choice-of-anchor protein, partial [Bacteroidota bacterium]|nr:Choice-of-anchor protein [Bacteroidota bacterium]
DGVYKIRASRPFAAYSFGYDWCDSYGYPTSAALADLEKPDTVCPDPKWNLKCDGTTEFATITDKPDDAEIRSNLAMIVFYDDSSYNYDFEYKDFIPGETVTTTWKLTVRDVSKDAKAVISFMDRVGNDTTIKIYYYAPDVSILPENYDYGRFKLGEQGEQEFRVVNNSDKGPFVVNKLEYLFKDQHFETVICPTLPYIIPPKGEMKFTVRFYAVEEGAFRDSIGVGDTCVFFYKAQVKARVGNPVILVGDQANLAIDVDFGNVNVGDKGEAQVRVHNKGTASLIVTGYSEFNNPTVFSHNILSLRDISPSNPLELLPNGTPFEFTVYFNPISDIPYNDQIVFFSDAKEIDSIAPIVGTGVLAQLKANGYNWGRKRIDRPGTFPIAAYPVDVAAGTVIRLENQGTADVHVDSVIIDESINPEAFEINGVPFNKNIFVDFPVHAKSFKDFVVKFHPTMVGEHKLVLRYINDVGADAKTILEGIGILPQIQTTDMDFDTTIIDDMADIKNRTISITNTAYQWDDSVTISDLTILPTGIEIEPAGLPVDFGTEGFKFDKASLGLPIVLQPGESLDIPAKFVAKHIDMHNAAIKTVSDAQTDVTSNWTGFGLSQGVSTTGSSADICTGATADLPCTISNTGTSVLRIDDLQIDPQNPYASLFTIKLPAGVTVPFTIPGNSSQDLIVTFTPGQQVVNATVDLVVYNNTKKQAVVKQSLTGVSRHFKGDFTPVLTMGTNKNLKEVTIGDEFYYQMSFAPTGDVAMAQVKDVVIKFSYKKDFLAVDLNKINLGPQFQFFQKTATAKEIDAVNNIEQVTITLHSDTQILNMSGDFLSIGFHVFMPWADITKSEKAVIDSSATITMDEQTATGNLCFDLYGGDVSVNLRPICVTNLRIIALNPNYNYMLYDISPNPVSANGADVRFTLGLEAYTEVKVYNTSGELESILAADRMKPGEYSVPLPIDQLSSGVYMLKLKSGPFEESKKLVIAK